MIRIRIKNYNTLRREYLNKLAKTGAAMFDENDILNIGTDHELNEKSNETYEKLKERPIQLSGIRQYLFNEPLGGNAYVNRKNLQELLAGPEEMPQSLGGNGESSLLSFYNDIIEKFNINKFEDDDFRILKEIFRYDKLSQANNKELPYWLMKELHQETCPYCNVGYIPVIMGREKSFRAALDHFFPKSKYPFLAISLFNLIPVCDMCNSIKGEKDSKNFIYPYEEGFDEGEDICSFQLIPDAGHPEVWKGISDSFKIEFRMMNIESHQSPFGLELDYRKSEVEGNEYLERVYDNIRYLCLEEVYSDCHNEEIRKLIRNYYEYNANGIEMILKSLPSLKKDKAHLREMLFFAFLNEEEWSKSPLNKLKHDLLDQLNEEYNNGKQKSSVINKLSFTSRL